MILLISYEIANKTRDLSELREAIKSSGIWWHHIDNVWLIDTNLFPRAWYRKLVKHIFNNDNLIIIEITDHYYGWLPESAWQWIEERKFRIKWG